MSVEESLHKLLETFRECGNPPPLAKRARVTPEIQAIFDMLASSVCALRSADELAHLLEELKCNRRRGIAIDVAIAERVVRMYRCSVEPNAEHFIALNECCSRQSDTQL